MNEAIDSIVKSFSESDISEIAKYTLRFARNVTKNILDNNYKLLKDLVEISCEIRDEVEVDGNIERNKEFYFGYWYAYENIGRRILEYHIVNEGIGRVMNESEGIQKLTKMLAKNKVATKQDIRNYFQISSDKFDNFIHSNEIKELDLICEDRIGNNVIYSLNRKGRKYYGRR